MANSLVLLFVEYVFSVLVRLFFSFTAMLKKEYSERETTYVTPFPWLEDWQLALNDIFIKVRMVGRDTQRSGQLKTKERDMYDVFEGHEHCESPRIVLVEGAPGSGKTVFCQKLATDWSKGQTGASFPHFRVVLNLKCRDIFYTSGELDAKALKDSIVDQLLPPDAPEELKEALFEYVETDNCEVLLILDGLDECKRAVDLNSLKKQLRSWHCKFLFTSRNEPKLRRSCDSLYQIVEFTDNDAVTYIEKFFGDEGEEMAASLIAKIGSDSLHDLVTNPLTTSLVCFVFNETGGELPPSKAKLYEELTRCVLLRKYKKDRREAPEDPLKTHEEDLAVLGRLALKGIDKGQLHFEEHEFNAEGRASDVLRFGFLIREKTASKRVNSPHGFQFVHKTLQEYFAAFYLCTQLLSHDSDDCLRLLDNKTEEELSHQYKQVLRFLVGMLSAKGEQAKSVARDLFTSLARRESEQVFFSGFICDLLQECASVNPAFSEAMVQPVKDRWECRELRLDGAQTNEADVRFRVACAVVKADRPLECLSFNYNSLCDLSSLAEALHSNRSLRWLRFRGCPLTAKSLGTLAVSLTQNRTLKKLSLDRRFKDFQALKNLQELNPRLGIAFI